MRFYGRAESAATQILAAFQSGNLPQAIAPIFISRKDELPCRKWSYANQLLCLFAGCSDARGFRQWEAVGRHVKKGEKARAAILVPCVRKETREDGTERTHLYGFKSQVVFDAAQTDGAELPPAVDPQTSEFLRALPLREVAESWGLSVDAINGKTGKALGWYRHKQAIALGVQNLATWAHELCHAADDRLGGLVERGQHWRSETVAELGGAILLCCIGLPIDADTGGAWDYISRYARDAEIEPITACMTVLKRTCDAVALILDTAEQLDLASALTLDGVTEEQYAAASAAIQVAE